VVVVEAADAWHILESWKARRQLQWAAAMEAEDLEISVPLNCGAEVYDVVTVTDAVVGLSAAKRRVLSIGFRYQASGPSTGSGRAGEPRYEAVLGLGAE